MIDWRLAEALKELKDEINARYPGRDKTSDGAIGDAAHASRSSDHNPWIWDPITKKHVVSAIDIDEDLTGSIHSLKTIIDAICKSRDPRVKYIIYEGQITVQGTQLQQWKRYTGKNSHSHHAHISVFPEKRLYDDRRPWSIGDASIAAKDWAKENIPVKAQILEIPQTVPAPQLPPIVAKADGEISHEAQPASDVAQPPPVSTTVEKKTVEESETPAGGTQQTITTETQSPTVEVKKERPSIRTTLIALGTALLGAWKFARENFGELVDKAGGAIDAHFIANTLIGAGLVALGIWLYDRSSKRANALNQAKIAHAGDRDTNTVELT
jgi:hypothetical protein